MNADMKRQEKCPPIYPSSSVLSAVKNPELNSMSIMAANGIRRRIAKPRKIENTEDRFARNKVQVMRQPSDSFIESECELPREKFEG